LTKNGNYKNWDLIESINILSHNDNYIKMKHDRSRDNRYVGVEDIRLFAHNGKLLYNGNRATHDGMAIEHGEIDITTGKTNSVVLTSSFQKKLEKNWVLFEDAERNLKCIYGWHPLVIGDINNDVLEKHTNYLPLLFSTVFGVLQMA